MCMHLCVYTRMYVCISVSLTPSVCVHALASNPHWPSNVTEQDPLSSWVPSTPALCPDMAWALLSPNARQVPNR